MNNPTNISSSEKDSSISKEPVEECKQLSLNMQDLPKLIVNTVKCEDDEETVEKSYSPSKYFGKRPSFEFNNLRKIERTTHRAFSAIHKKREEQTEKSPSNVTNDEGGSEKDMENSKVHFSNQIIEDEKENILSPTTTEKKTKKPKKSILKKTHFNEEITLDKLFKDEIVGEFIQKFSLECGKEGKHFSEKLPKCFVEHWKSIGHDSISSILFLKGIYTENLQYIFKDGIEFNVLLTIVETLKNSFENNMLMTYEFLRYFPTIKKFDIVASCLLPKEKEEINGLIEKLSNNHVIEEKVKEELKSVYFL